MFIPEEEPIYPEMTKEEIEEEFEIISENIQELTTTLLDMDIHPDHIAHELIMNGYYLLRAAVSQEDYFSYLESFYKNARKIPDFTELDGELDE